MSAPKFPPGVVPNYVNPVSRGHEATDAALVSLTFAAVFVALRLFTKFCVTYVPGWDDACSVVALMFAIPRLGFAYHLVDMGYGRHIWDVPPSNYSDFNIFLGSDQMLYFMGIAFAKLAVLILQYRIFSINRIYRWTCIALGPIIFCWAFISVFVSIFRCRPFVAAWDVEWLFAHPGGFKCLDRILITTVFGWFNIISDLVLLLLPMPMLWTLHLSWQKRLGLALVFATGGFVCAISIIRQVILYGNNASGAKETDGTWTEIPNYVWFSLELNLAILCGCLPIVHPLLRRIPALQDYLPVSLRSLFSAHSVMSKSNRSKKSTQEGRGIELAEEGRAIGKKPSQDSGDETLIDSKEDQNRWPGAIVRTDQYDVSTLDVQEEKRRSRANQPGPIIYQG